MKIIAVISIVLISSVNGCNQYDSILCQEYIETINLENDTSIVDNVLYVNDISTCSKVAAFFHTTFSLINYNTCKINSCYKFPTTELIIGIGIAVLGFVIIVFVKNKNLNSEKYQLKSCKPFTKNRFKNKYPQILFQTDIH